METESPLKRVAQKQAEYEKAQQESKYKKAAHQRLEDAAEALSALENKKKTEGETVESLEKEAEKAKGPGPWGDKKTDIVGDIQAAKAAYKATTGFNPNTIVMPKAVYEQMTLNLINDKLVFPKVPVAGDNITYTIKTSGGIQPQPEEHDYEIKVELSPVQQAAPLGTLNSAMQSARDGLLARLAGKSMKSNGDVRYAFELDEDGDMWVTARTLASRV